MRKYIILGLFHCFFSCTKGYQQEDKKGQATVTDTINFGTYCNKSYTKEFGHISIKDENGKEISSFENDTTYKVNINITGKRDIPFRVISLNKNITIKPLELKNKFLFVVKRIINDSLYSDGKKTRYDAQISLIAKRDSIQYVIRNRSWEDSTKIKYQDYIHIMDTIGTEYIKIK